ncbi:RecT-like ssDNA binding protein [Mycobacterium phage Bipper]|uniref:RecT ssDNA binding protein n=1 Tax=Mycobacterium phage Bipper TaxID=1805457 RepID=A0A142F2J3_9CAUD|nr:RecT-like ssDNA annealing protein [Mycobacterium phage Bipper]AMQ67000.1 RecT-like ssDNA binding protein [Mycobacterium phage Bipper]
MTEQSTDVVVPDEQDVQPFDTTELYTAPTTPALQRMGAEAAAMDTAFRIAKAMSKTNMVPQRFQWYYVPTNNNPNRECQGINAAYDLAGAIMYGSEIGLSALQAAQNVFPVHGQPAVYAKTMVAQIRAWIDQNGSGGGPDGDDIWEVSASPERVVWAGRRNGKTASAEWTIERADRAGFTRNPLYQKMPTEMLRAKAQTEVSRILWPDVLLGMSNSVEDLQLADGTVVQRVTSSRPTKAKGVAGLLAQAGQATAIEQRHPAEPGPADQSVEQAPIPEQQPIPAAEPQAAQGDPAPAVGDDDPAAGAAPEEPALVSRKQLTEVKRALAKETFTNPKGEDTLAYVGQIIGGAITDLAELTEAQAAEVLSILTATPTTENSEESSK